MGAGADVISRLNQLMIEQGLPLLSVGFTPPLDLADDDNVNDAAEIALALKYLRFLRSQIVIEGKSMYGIADNLSDAGIDSLTFERSTISRLFGSFGDPQQDQDNGPEPGGNDFPDGNVDPILVQSLSPSRETDLDALIELDRHLLALIDVLEAVRSNGQDSQQDSDG